GQAHGLYTSPTTSTTGNSAVFYTSIATARSLAGLTGYNFLAFRLQDDRPAAQTAAVAAISGYLKAQTGSNPLTYLPGTRNPGDWPGRSGFDDIMDLFLVIAVLAMLCALFLIANTMNTLVVEQNSEIAILKTLGGRRRQIAGVILRSAGLLGLAGGLAGTAAGIGLGYLLVSHFARSLIGVHAGFAVSVPMVVATLLAGPVLAVTASIPGLRRAMRRPIAEVIANRAAAGYGEGRLDRLVARSHLLPGPARMGIRNVLRQKRRSASTIAQVAVAVALALALFAVGRSAAVVIDSIFGAYHFSVEVDAYNGAPQLDSRAQAVAAATPGVASVEPVVENGVQYRGSSYPAYGLGSKTLYQYQLSAGRWFTPADATAAVPPVVLGPAFARTAHASVGSLLTFATPAGPTPARVIGLDTGQLDNGTLVFFPLAVLQRLSGLSGSTNALWLTTTSQSHAAIDRASTAVVDQLAAAGFPVQTQERYVATQQNQSQISGILLVLEVLGALVVAITLIGLVSALTMGIIERTREVGILRCLGARARQVRRVFSAEAVAMTTAGWLFGVVFGYLLFLGLLDFIRHLLGVQVPRVFPLSAIPVALVLMVAITLLVIRMPLRRAVRIEPSNALRYE
ncbi:MAG: FtsX-like permease family protein, partial [Actinomycetota bacterium]